jgi:hypothetical protein
VRFAGLAGRRGTAQVTAKGSDGRRCKVTNNGGNGTAMEVDVRCTTVAGAVADSPFTVGWTR